MNEELTVVGFVVTLILLLAAVVIIEITYILVVALLGGSSPESPSNHHSEQLKNLGLSTERLQVLECLTILTRSLHNCRVFSYYGGVQRVTSLLKGRSFPQLLIAHSKTYSLWVLDFVLVFSTRTKKN